MTRYLRALFCLPIIACKGNPPAAPPATASCPEVAAHVQTLFGGAADAFAVEASTVFQARCEADAWPDAMRTCLAATRSLAAPQQCKQHIRPEQAASLEREVEAVDRRIRTRDLPAACVKYGGMLAQVMTCDRLPIEARTALQQRFEAAKTEWASQPELLEQREQVCAAAITAVKQAAADCPDAKRW